MTARLLAEIVAQAARRSPDLEMATGAVLTALRTHEAWFCRWVEDRDGFTLTSPYAPEPTETTR